MFRVTNTFKTLAITKEVVSTNSYVINSQTVRWRKPRWIPKAKSKIFKVPPRTIIPEEEKIELQRLNNNYRTQIKSIRKYLHNEYCCKFGVSKSDPEVQENTIEDYARCMKLNDKWNEEQKVLREKRTAEMLEAKLNFARQRLERVTLKQEEELQRIEGIVRKEKEQSKSFITPENIDSAVEQALANVVDYDFAINLNGDKLVGSEREKPRDEKASITQ